MYTIEQTRTIPLEDFFKNDEKTYFQISPLGGYVSYMAPHNNRMNIFVQTVGGTATRLVTFEEDRSISNYIWKNESCLLYSKDSGGNENFHLYSVGLESGIVKDLTPFGDVVATILDRLPQSDTDVLITLNRRDPQLFDVYRLQVLSGELTLVAQNPGNIMSWKTDHDGNIRIATTSDGVNSTILYRDNASDDFRPILTTTFRDTVSPLLFTFDNRQLYAASNLGRDKAAIVVFDPQTATETEQLFSHPDVDVSDLSYSRKRKVLTAVYYNTDRYGQHFFDAESERIYACVADQLGNELEIYFVATTKAEDRFLVRTISDRSKGTFYLYDVATNELSKLADVAPWLHADELAQMQAIRYTSRDGLTINGYLTLPVGKEARNLPVIVNPHGGPWHRDSWGFNPEIQFFANRGYAVLQMNFRGSTGYGRSFWEASFKEWGQSMQNDITDGVHWLVEQGIADPQRVAIYGASYGGYATLAGVTFTPDLYACAVDYVGVSNLFTFMKSIPPYWKPFLDMMYEMVGNPEHDHELLLRNSPVFHVDQIKAPLMVVQGAKDPRVNINESDQIVEALRLRGVTVQYLVKENEGHGFMNQENKFELYRAMEAFWQQYL